MSLSSNQVGSSTCLPVYRQWGCATQVSNLNCPPTTNYDKKYPSVNPLLAPNYSSIVTCSNPPCHLTSPSSLQQVEAQLDYGPGSEIGAGWKIGVTWSRKRSFKRAATELVTIIATLHWASCGPGTGLQAHPLKSQYRFAFSQEI